MASNLPRVMTLVSLFGAVTSSLGAQTRFSDFKELSRMVLEIAEITDPESTLYIGAGRSATPIVALLETMLHEQVAHVPISGMNSFYHPPDESELVEDLAEHLTRFLPRVELAAAKTIVLLDYVVSGSSLSRLHAAVERVLQMNKLSAKVVSVGIGPDTPKFVRKDLFEEKELHFIKPGLITYRFRNQHFDMESPYGTFYAANLGRSRTLMELIRHRWRRAEYIALLSRIRKWALADKGFQEQARKQGFDLEGLSKPGFPGRVFGRCIDALIRLEMRLERAY